MSAQTLACRWVRDWTPTVDCGSTPRRGTETLGEQATDGASLAEALGGRERRDPASVQRRISPSDGVDRVLGQYDYHERNHQGLDTRLILPLSTAPPPRGRGQCRQRLGGMLNYYYRSAA